VRVQEQRDRLVTRLASLHTWAATPATPVAARHA